ncbi:MAG: antitoxin, partial [Verrucomicrobiia bacterium]
MAAQTLSLTEAARNFSDCINRVAYRGESFLLVRGRRAVAEIRPAPAGRRLADLPAVFASLPPLPEAEAV